MARRLIMPLVLLLIIVIGLVYVGSDKWLSLEILSKAPDTLPEIGFAMSLQLAILAGCAGVVGIIGLWSLSVWMWRLPRRMKSGFGRKRETHGLDAVEEALIAGEAGNSIRARRKAEKAHELLDRPGLTKLVSAKAAEAAGAFDEARTHYTALLEDPKTETAGQRGLVRLAETDDNHVRTTELAHPIYEASKDADWAFDPLFNAQLNQSDWNGALETLELGEKRKHVEKDAARRRRAVLRSALAVQLEKDGDTEGAISAALSALDASSGFAPAAALAARLLLQTDQSKKAASVIEKTWNKAPHPALALAYRDVFSGERASIVAKKIKNLARINSSHRESAILTAEQALLEKDGMAAITALGGLLRAEDPSARLCVLASAAEERLGNPIDARAWHLRAASAPLEADWSDLDPDGPAFNYADIDWRRMVKSYGETGELIHPRFESGGRRRAAIIDPDAPDPVPEPAAEIDAADPINDEAAPSPDDPGVIIDEGDAKDLASRLNKLLGSRDKT